MPKKNLVESFGPKLTMKWIGTENAKEYKHVCYAIVLGSNHFQDQTFCYLNLRYNSTRTILRKSIDMPSLTNKYERIRLPKNLKSESSKNLLNKLDFHLKKFFLKAKSNTSQGQFAEWFYDEIGNQLVVLSVLNS